MSELIFDEVPRTTERGGRTFDLGRIGDWPTRAYVAVQSRLMDTGGENPAVNVAKSTAAGVVSGYLLGKGMQSPIDRESRPK